MVGMGSLVYSVVFISVELSPCSAQSYKSLKTRTKTNSWEPFLFRFQVKPFTWVLHPCSLNDTELFLTSILT